MVKNEYQEIIAKVICDKLESISCDDCFKSTKGKICNGFKRCRISEKTEDQMEYVMSSINENIFLKACAGSGKTEVVGLKAAYEIKQWKYDNRGVAFLSFTNDATAVIEARVKQFAGKEGAYPHYIGTLSSFIHSYIVQPFAYKLIDFQGKKGDYSLRVVDEKMPIYTNHWLMNYACKIRYLNANNIWSDICAHQIGFDLVKKDFYFYINYKTIWLRDYYYSERVQQFIESKRKTQPKFMEFSYVKDCFISCKKAFWKQGFINFDDLNYWAVRVLKKNMGDEIVKRFPLILIDECQDLSGNELAVLRQLKEKGCHMHFIGDLNQSIYEFKRVNPNEINAHIKEFTEVKLNLNFRSCKEIVIFSERLIAQAESTSENVESKFGEQALIYIEYKSPEEAIQKYIKLLYDFGVTEYDNRILVKQNSLRKQLEKSTKNELDTKESLIVAVQLWHEKSQQKMNIALELAGWQISKWFGGGRTRKNYYCPQDISSVFKWRIFLMEILNEIEKSKTLMDFSLTYGKWHEKARKELNDFLLSQYSTIAYHDENKDRDINKMVNGNNFKVSSGNKDKVIKNFVEKCVTDIPIMTIHGSKGCTYDTTLVISSKTVQSEGGHWKAHWIEGNGEDKRIGYVASTRAKYLLVWGVPMLKKDDRKLLESYGFINSETVQC